MSTMDRRFDDIEELLGAYALDAVDAEERRAVEAYLESHPRARAEVDEHREVASRFAFTGADAPEGLWDRIAAALDEHPDDVPEPGPELAKVLPVTKRRSWRGWLIGLAAAVVAVIAAVSVVILRDNGSTSGVAGAYEEARSNPANKTVPLATPDGATKATAVIEASGTAFLDASGLPALGDDRTYQLWAVLSDSPQPVSLGLLGARPGITMFGVNGPVAALAITDERAGGVAAPERPPQIVGAVS